MNPTRNALHPVDQLLTDYAIGYAQDRAKAFVAGKVGTVKKVTKSSDRYVIWDKGDQFRSEMQQVSRHDPAPAGGIRMSTDVYTALEYALKTFLNDKDVTDADVDVRRKKTNWLIDQALLKRDLVVASKIFATGLWTSITEQTGVASGPTTNQFLRWDVSGSVPLKDVIDAKEAVRSNCGSEANVMVTSQPVINALRNNSSIVSRFQYTKGGAVTFEDLKNLLEIDIVVGKSMQNTAKEQATVSLSDVWGKHALFLYVDPNAADQETPTAVTTFSWSEYDKMTEDGATINSWRENDPAGEWLKVEAAYDSKITANDCGQFHLNAVS